MENREWRMRLMSDWQTVVGVIRLFRETENGEGRMRLMSDWQTVVGVIRLYRETENGEWRMRLSRNSSPFSILHSPFFFLRSQLTISANAIQILTRLLQSSDKCLFAFAQPYARVVEFLVGFVVAIRVADL